jgi:hypothetical protein
VGGGLSHAAEIHDVPFIFGGQRKEMCGSVRPFVALTVLKHRTVEKAL